MILKSPWILSMSKWLSTVTPSKVKPACGTILTPLDARRLHQTRSCRSHGSGDASRRWRGEDAATLPDGRIQTPQ